MSQATRRRIHSGEPGGDYGEDLHCESQGGPNPVTSGRVLPRSARVRTTPSSRRSSLAASRSRCPWNSVRISSRPRASSCSSSSTCCSPAASPASHSSVSANCSPAPVKASSRQAGACPYIELLLVRSGRQITRTVTSRSLSTRTDTGEPDTLPHTTRNSPLSVTPEEPHPSGFVYWVRLISGGYLMSNINLFAATASGNLRVGYYPKSGSGTTAHPGTLGASSVLTAMTGNLMTIPLSGSVTP